MSESFAQKVKREFAGQAHVCRVDHRLGAGLSGFNSVGLRRREYQYLEFAFCAGQSRAQRVRRRLPAGASHNRHRPRCWL